MSGTAHENHGTRREIGLRLVVHAHSDAYADLTDRRLAAILAEEDAAEERGLSPHERISCRLHRRWAHQCIASPMHVIPVTGHRWCRDCRQAMTVAVDELDGEVTLTCPRCGEPPASLPTRQIVRTCRASIAAARGLRTEERVSA